MEKIKLIAVPGSFDPIHPGHVHLLRQASRYGSVVVILKGDKRLAKKKKILMSVEDRKQILEAIRYVSSVYVYDSDIADHEDFTKAIIDIKPDIVAFGEKEEICLEPKYVINKIRGLGIEILYGVGGSKIHSSSQILKDYTQ